VRASRAPLALQLFDDREYQWREPSSFPCGRCGAERPTPRPDGNVAAGGADACLGWLSDVAHACCGHGTGEPYVIIAPGCYPSQPACELADAVTLWGEDALVYFRRLGVRPPTARQSP
jgi:hypothetical protein